MTAPTLPRIPMIRRELAFIEVPTAASWTGQTHACQQHARAALTLAREGARR